MKGGLEVENQLSFDQHAMYISLLYKLYLIFCTRANLRNSNPVWITVVHRSKRDVSRDKNLIRELSQSNWENDA